MTLVPLLNKCSLRLSTFTKFQSSKSILDLSLIKPRMAHYCNGVFLFFGVVYFDDNLPARHWQLF